MNSPEILETEKAPEPQAEKGFETNEKLFFQAAELLENPADDSYKQGLQTFIAWVKALLAGDKQNLL